MNKRILTARLNAPVSRVELIQRYCRGKNVLDIGCVQHDAINVETSTWLHQAIVEVAASVLGVDYLEPEVVKLRARGYNVITADITTPLALEAKFDVIVVGNLIEHLSNFDGLLSNMRQLLQPEGCVLISTANPFYREQYFYAAFKNEILVNPEHTCWIDPVTLEQLCCRWGWSTQDVFWVKEKWDLSQVILHGDARFFDLFTGRWIFNRPAGRIESAFCYALTYAFRWFMPTHYTERVFARYRGDTGRLLYLKFVETIFQACWVVYRAFIVTSPINKYELFVSVLRASPSRPDAGGRT